MEQRIYRGDILPEELADHLVNHFNPLENVQAQRFGEGDSCLVQIGRGDVPADLRYALTLTITQADNEAGVGIAVTMGQQKWVDPKQAGFAALIGLIGLLITPWVLFALLWPVGDLTEAATLPDDAWEQVEIYVTSEGGAFAETRELTHPHQR